MIGAIIGDIAGSTYEFHSIKTMDFPLFAPGSSYTDDSLMSIAVASALMQTGESHDGFKSHAVTSMRQIATKYPYPMGGYGGRFRHWLVSSDPQPYGSFGNGSAMRVSPCGDVAATLDEALALAKQSAEVTHSHPEGIKGVQAVAAAIYLARTGESRDGIRSYIEQNFYPLEQTVDEIRPRYAELEHKIQSAVDRRTELKSAITSAQARMQEISKQKKAILVYRRTKDVYTQYRESGWSPAFYREHKADIDAHTKKAPA